MQTFFGLGSTTAVEGLIVLLYVQCSWYVVARYVLLNVCRVAFTTTVRQLSIGATTAIAVITTSTAVGGWVLPRPAQLLE